MTDAPERIYLDGDVEAGDGQFPRCFEDAKYASEPPVEYIRADLSQAAVEALEAKLAKAKSAMKELAYWFDTDLEILDAMSAECRADHERQVAKINRTRAELTGGKDD